MTTTEQTATVTAKPGGKGSRFLSTCEVGECIRCSSPVFHPLVSPVGQVAREILSPYDKATTEAALDGFALRPNTITDMESRIAFSARVYEEWIQHSALTYNGTVLPGVSYVEATGRFRLDSPGPGPFPGDYFIDKAGLRRTLSSLADVALSEAVKRHLTEGGDERLCLLPAPGACGSVSGVNKYHCPPCPVPRGTVVRSSCTCSPPSATGFEAARSRLQALWNGSLSAEDAFNELRSRISAALGIKTAHHVVLHPSGTDAEFTALLVGLSQARKLGCTGVVNIVVGAKEVGSNTAAAAGGRHFSKYFPTELAADAGVVAEGDDASQSMAVSGSDLRDGVQVVELAARRDNGSTVPDFDGLVLRALEEASVRGMADKQEKPFFVMHAVDGSKLGSHVTSRSLVEKIRSRYGDRVLFVLDACQARTDTDELDWYLSRGAVVLITASKFYGAPGFCAAALVPHTAAVASQLTSTRATVAPGLPVMMACGLGSYITQLEVPSDLDVLRSSLPAGPTNVGLLLRWSCGVAEMERFARAGLAGRQAIERWVHRIRELIRERDPQLQLLRDGGCDNSDDVPFPAAATFVGGVNSIVSFGVLRAAGTGVAGRSLLNAAALRRFHRWLTMDVSEFLPASAADVERQTARLKCFIGQPVDLGDFAVLRLAMGASLASDMAEGHRHLDDVLADDGKVLDKIQLAIKYWGVFCEKDGE